MPLEVPWRRAKAFPVSDLLSRHGVAKGHPCDSFLEHKGGVAMVWLFLAYHGAAVWNVRCARLTGTWES